MKRSSSASSANSDSSSDTSDSDSAADNKKKREEEEEDLWQHLTYWTLEEEEEDSELMDQDNRVFAKIYAVDAENGATTEQLIELFDPFFDDGGVTDSELMMVCLVSGSL